MKIFSQFLTSGEHERLIESIERERELRHRINELLKYRGMGLMTQEEIVHYEQHVAFQTQQQLRQNQAQWLPNNNTRVARRKRGKRRKPKFHRRKVHGPSRRLLHAHLAAQRRNKQQ